MTDQSVAQFQRDGFLNGGPLLTPGGVAELSKALDEVIKRGPDGFSDNEPRPVLFRDLNASDYLDASKAASEPVWQIVNIWEASDPFRRLIHHPAIVGAVARLTGFKDLQVWHDQVQYKPPRAGGSTSWHQDAPLWPAIEPMTPVSAWIPLDDADVANGCMWMVPGSHRWGNQRAFLETFGNLKDKEEFTRFPPFEPPADAPIRTLEARPCPVQRGSVHFHHSLTWHGSPTNRSERPRRAVAIHFMSCDARFTGREHVMNKFISLKPGDRMEAAGPHFPRVWKDGRAVPAA
jgi:ectoine hydroxylase-related dioxygenase (phytanoyl-CoA dioxygenase family)